jgi:hypothetical protein
MTEALLAHVSSTGGGGGGGPNLFLVLAGLAVVATALGMGSRGASGMRVGLLVLVGVVVAAFGLVATGEPRPDVTLLLATPDPGTRVPANEPVPVNVEVVGGKVARSPTDSGGHLHLSVDGTLEQMPYGTRAEVRLSPGTHLLRVEYVDNKHVSYKPPIAVEVRIDAA